MKKGMTWVLVAAVVGLLTGAAFAQFAKAEEAVKYRQSVMSVIGTHFSRMGAVVKGEAPYAKEAFEQNASIVAMLIPLPWDAFMAAGSDKGSGMKADALSKKDDFMKLAAIKPQFGAAGASCKACHDAYRNK